MDDKQTGLIEQLQKRLDMIAKIIKPHKDFHKATLEDCIIEGSDVEKVYTLAAWRKPK